VASAGLAIEARRGAIERGRSIQGRVHSVVGFVEVTGVGEAIITVTFPVTFIERPTMLFGGELGTNGVLVDGSFPTINVMVKEWTTYKKQQATYWTGAVLVLVATGSSEQQIIANWKADPLHGPTATDDVI